MVYPSGDSFVHRRVDAGYEPGWRKVSFVFVLESIFFSPLKVWGQTA